MALQDNQGTGKGLFQIRARNRQFDGFDKEHERTWRGPFTFIASADIQFGMSAAWDDPTVQDCEPEVKLMRKGIEKINKMQPSPRFLVVLGDLIDANPGTAGSDGQVTSFIEESNRLNPCIPLVCLPGNHDIGDVPTPEDIQSYRNTFGDDYFAFWVGGVRFIVLNSQLFADSSKCEEVKREQDLWLDQQLEDAQSSGCKHIVVFQHIPWFLKTPEEDNDYFNTDLSKRTPMLKKLHEAGVRIIFSGHYHRRAGGFYKEMEHVVASAWGFPLGEDKSGAYVVKVTVDAISHQFYPIDELPLES
ncbi:serine/threonine-protein phosphatase CPPED1-like [Asterias rubens]|uniref:serine/threonine-protein phosphatase CPPED1-like n=1 Tax=Asterias rubens TaxID=7604 RepID=UPI0014557FCA|nr:serine/threonine-protein phosphatase CPPED1-like [Asterias rubens]